MINFFWPGFVFITIHVTGYKHKAFVIKFLLSRKLIELQIRSQLFFFRQIEICVKGSSFGVQ